jgi:hypothetical protein
VVELPTRRFNRKSKISDPASLQKVNPLKKITIPIFWGLLIGLINGPLLAQTHYSSIEAQCFKLNNQLIKLSFLNQDKLDCHERMSIAETYCSILCSTISPNEASKQNLAKIIQLLRDTKNFQCNHRALIKTAKLEALKLYERLLPIKYLNIHAVK